MTNDEITKLFKQKLILKHLSKNTIKSYMSKLRKLILFIKTDVDSLTQDQLNSFFVHIKTVENISDSGFNQTLSMVIILLDGLNLSYELPTYIKPKAGSYEVKTFRKPEVELLVKNTDGLMYKCIFMVMATSGIRLESCIRLKPKHIDSKNMQIILVDAKNHSSHRSILSKTLLVDYLRPYYRSLKIKPMTYLFESPVIGSTNYVSKKTVQRKFQEALIKSNLKQSGIILHSLRKFFSSSLLKAGYSIKDVSKLMNHQSCSVTLEHYIAVSNDELLKKIVSPFDV